MVVIKVLFTGVLAAALSAGIGGLASAQQVHDHAQAAQSRLHIPDSLKVEHQELHGELAAATQLPGRTGEAAQKVAALLHEHFESEEEFALPPLGLLVPLTSGVEPSDARDVVAMTDRLKADLPRMLNEHKAIVAALEQLVSAGKAEGHPQALAFADKLKLHAQNEEQVLYPAALLVGEYLKLKFPR